MHRRTILAALPTLAAATTLAGPARAAEPPMIAGPDPNTRPPVYRAPAGAVDTHTHIFGPPEKYPYWDKRPYTPPPAPLPMFAELHRKLGIDRAVIVNATVHGYDNSVVLDAIAQSGGRYLGIGNIEEDIADAELERLNSGGLRGCRFTFLARLGGKPDLSRVERISARVAELGWHVDLYFEGVNLPDFLPTLKRLRSRYVIDHMGACQVADGIDHPGFAGIVNLLRDDEKCWMKLTGPERMSATGAPFRDAVPFAQRLIAAAPERVIWGTDWPHPNVKVMPNDGDLVDLIPLYAPDAAQQRQLLIDNPTRLFGFKS